MSPSAKHASREASLWATAALGALALVYFFDDMRSAVVPAIDGVRQEISMLEARDAKRPGFAREVRLKADGRGHFVLDASVNDRAASFMADTGATLVALTYEDAERLGLAPRSLDFSAQVQTGNGVARVARVTFDRVRVDDIIVRNVPAMVAERGALGTNLLGMSFLGRLKSFQMQGDELVLTE